MSFIPKFHFFPPPISPVCAYTYILAYIQSGPCGSDVSVPSCCSAHHHRISAFVVHDAFSCCLVGIIFRQRSSSGASSSCPFLSLSLSPSPPLSLSFSLPLLSLSSPSVSFVLCIVCSHVLTWKIPRNIAILFLVRLPDPREVHPETLWLLHRRNGRREFRRLVWPVKNQNERQVPTIVCCGCTFSHPRHLPCRLVGHEPFFTLSFLLSMPNNFSSKKKKEKKKGIVNEAMVSISTVFRCPTL